MALGSYNSVRFAAGGLTPQGCAFNQILSAEDLKVSKKAKGRNPSSYCSNGTHAKCSGFRKMNHGLKIACTCACHKEQQ